MIKISCVTPTVRPEGIRIVRDCLNKQTFRSFEWILISPRNTFTEDDTDLYMVELNPGATINFIDEPSKRKEDFYGLNKAFNAGFKEAKGELIVSIVDQTWIPNDCLEILWNNYEANPKACISAIGSQYEDNGNQEPQVIVWRDPRIRSDLGSFYETYPTEMEFCVASVPRQAIIDCGGIDPEFDKYAALSEKEMMARIEKLGYKLYIDQSIQYKAIHHDRLNGREEWDKHYFEGCKYYDKCIREIVSGTRLKLDNFL